MTELRLEWVSPIQPALSRFSHENEKTLRYLELMNETGSLMGRFLDLAPVGEKSLPQCRGPVLEEAKSPFPRGI